MAVKQRVSDAAEFDAKISRTLIAFSDPTRRQIIRRLLLGDARVTEVARPFSISLNSVSKHIRVLERAGLVKRRRVGREHILRFDPQPLDELSKIAARYVTFWEENLQRLDNMLRAEDNVNRVNKGERLE